ncbi:MAG TPA: hypothetical protein GX504_05035 [Clostridia bacterium]|nr:hypothetical protein [Clostridia bacterium]
MWWKSSDSNLVRCPFRKIEALLGFAAKAGKVVSGEEAVKAKLRHGKIHLLLLAEDASGEVVKYFRYKSEEMGVPLICAGHKIEIGWAIGKSRRAVVGITDPQFAKSILTRAREKQAME